MIHDLTRFDEGIQELGIVLSEEQKDQFIKYFEMMIEKNKVMNLTAITEFDDVIEKHFLDSLSIVKTIDFKDPVSILDLGTGAGFPGIPIKIAFPQNEILLMDTLNKKIVFLQEVIDALGLKGIRAVHGRAEEMARKKEYREQFDLCVSRAVANLASLSEYCIPFVKQEGCFISYKSGEIEDELKASGKAIHVLGGKLEQVVKFQLPNSDVSRSFVKIKKKKKTPGAYPRKAGTPAKDPLK